MKESDSEPPLTNQLSEDSQIGRIERIENKLSEIQSLLEELQKGMALLLGKKEIPSELLAQQREVLESIEKLEKDNFSQAKQLLSPIIGQPTTDIFTASFASILRKKEWGVACVKCESPSTLIWAPGPGYRAGGRAQYSHTGASGKSVIHGSTTVIREFKIVKRVDKRRRA